MGLGDIVRKEIYGGLRGLSEIVLLMNWKVLLSIQTCLEIGALC